MRQQKNPQQKKALSLEKDRRNCYGEHNKSSRRNIARGKARNSRAARRVGGVGLGLMCGPVSEDYADELQTTATTRWIPRFQKSADLPLGQSLARKKKTDSPAGCGVD